MKEATTVAQTYVTNKHPRGNQHIGKYGLLPPGQIKEVDSADLACICGEYVVECDSGGVPIPLVKITKTRGRAAESAPPAK